MPDQRPLIVYVDVDDTLVRSFGSKQMPIRSTIERIEILAGQPGVELYCWSSGGAEYARSTCERLGILALFRQFLAKPNLMVDDQLPSQWTDLLVVHPNEFEPDADGVRGRLSWVR